MKRRSFIRIGTAGAAGCTLLASRGLSLDVSNGTVEARFFERLPGKKIRCLLCPHQCIVADLERGNCGVRENRGGNYQTLIYGELCAMNIDPIEKKPLYHYYPTTQALSVATAGCNFFCKFCQNWEISQKRPEQIKARHFSPQRLIGLAKSRGCQTIAHTYTEPVVYYEYMFDCALKGKEAGIPNLMISNGFINQEPMTELCRHIGAVKIDLKAFTEEFYVKWCAGKLKPVMDTLILLKELEVWFEIVVLLIPDLNDSGKEIDRMSRWIVKELGPDVPVHFSRFYPIFMMKNVPPTPVSSLNRAWKIARNNGIKFVYLGNILSKYSNTYCPSCNRILIERVGFTTENKGMINDRCKNCQEQIPGVFNF